MKVETKQEVQQNKGMSEVLKVTWKPSKEMKVYDSLDSLLKAVRSDIKRGIERIYYVSVSLLMTGQDNNPLAERFTIKDTDRNVKSNKYLRGLAASWQRCGQVLANPPLTLFSEDYKSLYVVHGNSRTRALSIIKGVKYIGVRVKLPTQMTMEQAEKIAVDENRVRSKSSHYSIIMKILQMKRQGLSDREIAERRQCSHSFVTQMKGVGKNAFLLEAVRVNAISPSIAGALASTASITACRKVAWKSNLLRDIIRAGKTQGPGKLDIRNYYEGGKLQAYKALMAIVAGLTRPITKTEAMIKLSHLRSSGNQLLRLNLVRKASKGQINAAVAELKSYGVGG